MMFSATRQRFAFSPEPSLRLFLSCQSVSRCFDDVEFANQVADVRDVVNHDADSRPHYAFHYCHDTPDARPYARHADDAAMIHCHAKFSLPRERYERATMIYDAVADC